MNQRERKREGCKERKEPFLNGMNMNMVTVIILNSNSEHIFYNTDYEREQRPKIKPSCLTPNPTALLAQEPLCDHSDSLCSCSISRDPRSPSLTTQTFDFTP